MPRLRFSLRLFLIGPVIVAFGLIFFPEAQTGPPTFDMGPVPAGARIDHTFEIQNETGRPIQMVVSTLWSMKSNGEIHLSDERLIPGETSSFDVKFTVPIHCGAGQRIVRECEVRTNNAHQPSIRFRLIGTVSGEAGTNAPPRSLPYRCTRVKIRNNGTLHTSHH